MPAAAASTADAAQSAKRRSVFIVAPPLSADPAQQNAHHFIPAF
jgi:hypothetical protein